ncbi:uncharacterized protein LOC113873418 [Abrus precatorius]|uniref:Uncharacterized protein LOC113873418 n=1 Tax=Abrus precatorius TaxID=3816 RepID=A0A8B8MJA5_ABRPR|nr:uncharacterized protein LOC113873418 [Abrus precatorius]
MEEEEKAALLSENEEEDGEVKEVEIHLFRRGHGPIAVFKSKLGGSQHNQLEVRHILHNHSLKSMFAFNPQSGRAVPIRFNPKTGRSILTYRNGAVIFVDGEPKDSLLKPVTRILVGVVLITIMILLVSRESPQWIHKLNFSGVNFPPLILACVVIVFTRMRKRTKDFLSKWGL